VSTDAAKLSGTVLSEPAREQMPLEFNEQLVVEFYSR
jgi:ribosomal protein S4